MNAGPASFVSSPAARVAGEMCVPGDKSISHRAAMLGAIAEGTTEISGFLEAADCRATLAALAAMGIRIERVAPGSIRIHGAGLHGLRPPAGPLDLGNSGTSMRLLAGILKWHGIDVPQFGPDLLAVRLARHDEP